MPNQSQDDFESFANNFELNIDAVAANNPSLTVVLGDFNIKSNSWFKGDTVVLGDFNIKSNSWFKGDKTSYEGSKIDAINLPVQITTAN